MGIQVRWDNSEQTIIYCDFNEEWTLDDFHTMIDEIYALARSVSHQVYLISDYTRSRVPPRQWLSTGAHIEKRKSMNTELSIVVGANTFVNVMLNVAQKLFLKDFPICTVATLQEAYQIIEKHNQTLAA